MCSVKKQSQFMLLGDMCQRLDITSMAPHMYAQNGRGIFCQPTSNFCRIDQMVVRQNITKNRL